VDIKEYKQPASESKITSIFECLYGGEIMCGIVGYIGNQQAEPILMDCLSRLEYRGYDSSGIAVRENDQNNDIKVYKDAVRVAVLQKQSPHLQGSTGIAHTRWATHGPPSLLNAHPHFGLFRQICCCS